LRRTSFLPAQRIFSYLPPILFFSFASYTFLVCTVADRHFQGTVNNFLLDQCEIHKSFLLSRGE
jgi:hypothetical protein